VRPKTRKQDRKPESVELRAYWEKIRKMPRA